MSRSSEKLPSAEPNSEKDALPAPVRLLSKPEVLERTCVTFPTIWKWMREGTFPRSRVLGGKSAWLEAEVNDWILSRPVRRLKGDAT
jgi:predicted DNA-binding transcriptional regulator AlpA